MPFLYRTALIITRKQPYIDWANSFRDEETPEFAVELALQPDIYLGPHNDYQQTLEAVVDQIWQDIFEEELFGWSIDEDQWPVNRTRQMFDEWFGASLAESVIDLAPDDPLTEEDMDLAELETAMRTCGWCRSELEPAQVRMTTFKLVNHDQSEHREGRILRLLIGRDRIVDAVVAPQDSTPAREDADLIVPACSRRCEKQLLKVVPQALRDLEQRGRMAEQNDTERAAFLLPILAQDVAISGLEAVGLDETDLVAPRASGRCRSCWVMPTSARR